LFEKKLQEAYKKLALAENEKGVISKNYESQMKMLSEHIVELNLQNERLKGH